MSDLYEIADQRRSAARASATVDFLNYLESISGELSRMAIQARLPFLAYLLAMVRLETERILRGLSRASAVEQNDSVDPDTQET